MVPWLSVLKLGQKEVDPPMEGKYFLAHENSVVGLYIAAGLYLAAATSMIQRA